MQNAIYIYYISLLKALLEDNWESLNDSKTSKKQIWNKIADGLEEVFIVRGEDKGRTCQTKWENMRKEYRAYLSKFQTGSAASDTKKTPKFFDSIEKIIGIFFKHKFMYYRNIITFYTN